MDLLPKLTGPIVLPESGKPAQQLFIFLHGLGADGQDLISLADIFAPFFPDAQFMSPNAPFPCDMAPFGLQWFSLLDRSIDAMYAGVETVEPILNQFIDEQLDALNLREQDVVLVGFSQGTMTLLHTIFRRARPCAALVGFSGAMVGDGVLSRFIKSKTPTCLIHGTVDPIVPFEAMGIAETALKENGVECETHARSGLAHGIDQKGLEIAVRFVKQQFDKQRDIPQAASFH